MEWLTFLFAIHVPQYSGKKLAFNFSFNESRFALIMDKIDVLKVSLLCNVNAPHMSTQGFTNFDFSLFGFA